MKSQKKDENSKLLMKHCGSSTNRILFFIYTGVVYTCVNRSNLSQILKLGLMSFKLGDLANRLRRWLGKIPQKVSVVASVLLIIACQSIVSEYLSLDDARSRFSFFKQLC